MRPIFSLTLRIFVPAPMENGWSWTPWAGPDPVGTEELTSLTQLPRVLRTFGRAASLLILPKDADRFNVTAFGATSGVAYGRDQWFWDEGVRIFRPHGDPWAPRESSATQELNLAAIEVELPGRPLVPGVMGPAA